MAVVLLTPSSIKDVSIRFNSPRRSRSNTGYRSTEKAGPDRVNVEAVTTLISGILVFLFFPDLCNS